MGNSRDAAANMALVAAQRHPAGEPLAQLIPKTLDLLRPFGRGIGRYGSSQIAHATFSETGNIGSLSESATNLGICDAAVASSVSISNFQSA
jgi:hypothetical protein